MERGRNQPDKIGRALEILHSVRRSRMDWYGSALKHNDAIKNGVIKISDLPPDERFDVEDATCIESIDDMAAAVVFGLRFFKKDVLKPAFEEARIIIGTAAVEISRRLGTL